MSGVHPIDIMIVLSSLRGGGAERIAALLSDAWCTRGHTVVLVTMSGSDDDVQALDSRVERIALGLERDTGGGWAALMANGKRVLALRAVLRARRPHVALGFNTTTNVLLAFAARGSGARLVLAERNWPPRSVSGRAWGLLRRHAYGLADVVVAQTEAGAEWLRSHTRAQRVVVIPNPLVWPLISREPRISPDALVPAGAPLVLAVGNLASQKGHDLLLEAFARTGSGLGDGGDWHLAIIGGGDPSALMTQRDTLGLAARVHLVGRVGNVGEWLERASLFVMSSRFEGFPNALLEAMGAGLPVVSFDCPTGPRDMLRDGVDGVLVEALDVDALAVSMADLMRSPGERARLGTEARSVRDRFAIERVLARWAAVLRPCIANDR